MFELVNKAACYFSQWDSVQTIAMSALGENPGTIVDLTALTQFHLQNRQNISCAFFA
jgi:hypothetical protein